jgi:hypothetical protein
VKTRQESPIWKLDKGEQRQLGIAFAGGLASILAGACVLGVAVVLARDEERGRGFTLTGLVGYTATLGTLIILSSFGARISKSRLIRAAAQVALIILALLLAVMVLVWIGVAADLH